MNRVLWSFEGRGWSTVSHWGDPETRRTVCGIHVVGTGDDEAADRVECKRCLRLMGGK